MSHGNFLFAWAARNPRKTRSAYDTESVFVGAKSIPTVAIWLRNRLGTHRIGVTLFASVGTLSEGFERAVASPLLPRRLRAMGWAV